MDALRPVIVASHTLPDADRRGLAAAVVAAFGHAYPGWDATVALHELSNRDGLPAGVASLVDGRPAGCATLLADDEVDGLDGVGPWLANVWVEPSARGMGVGSALVEAIVALAEARGANALHLVTDTAVDWYASKEWQVQGAVRVHGTPMTHMARPLAAPRVGQA